MTGRLEVARHILRARLEAHRLRAVTGPSAGIRRDSSILAAELESLWREIEEAVERVTPAGWYIAYEEGIGHTVKGELGPYASLVEANAKVDEMVCKFSYWVPTKVYRKEQRA